MITKASKKGLHFTRGSVTQIQPHPEVDVVSATWDPDTLTATCSFAPEADGTAVADTVTIYTQAQLDTIEDALFAPTPAPIPAEVTPRQFRLALLQHNSSPAEVEAVIAGISDEAQKVAAEIEWEFASSIKRNHPLVAAFAAAMGKTEADVDAIFVTAQTIGG